MEREWYVCDPFVQGSFTGPEHNKTGGWVEVISEKQSPKRFPSSVMTVPENKIIIKKKKKFMQDKYKNVRRTINEDWKSSGARDYLLWMSWRTMQGGHKVFFSFNKWISLSSKANIPSGLLVSSNVIFLFSFSWKSKL